MKSRGPTLKQKYFDDVVESGSLKRLSGTAAKVLLALRFRADKNGHCYPGDARLHVEAGIARSSLATARKQLIRQGLIRYERRHTACPDGRVVELSHYTLQPFSEARLSKGKAEVEEAVRREREKDRAKKMRSRRRRASPQNTDSRPPEKPLHVPPGIGGEPSTTQDPVLMNPASKRALDRPERSVVHV